MKRIVLFVEGEGEEKTLRGLVGKLLSERNAWDAVFVDDRAFRMGQVNKLVKCDFKEWKRKLQAALMRTDVGGILLLLDGDIKLVGGKPFCAADVARSLAAEAVKVGAGKSFSVAVVFAIQEFETWLIAGVESLAGKPLPDGRHGIAADVARPEGDLEKTPRDAKGWISRRIPGGYKPTRDQAMLTQLLDTQCVRDCGLRSFQRFESAVEELITAVRENNHVSTPTEGD